MLARLRTPTQYDSILYLLMSDFSLLRRRSLARRPIFSMDSHTCLMIFIYIIYGGFSLHAVITSLYAMTYSLYLVPSPLYVVLL